MAKIKITGDKALSRSFDAMRDHIKNTEPVAKALAQYMRQYVHVRTGYLRSTIYHRPNLAGAKSDYAGYEAERGGSHAYDLQAIESTKLDLYADRIEGAFRES